ncbi:MAG: hypothetical protein ACREBA_01675 [Nitrosotalea sp.]
MFVVLGVGLITQGKRWQPEGYGPGWIIHLGEDCEIEILNLPFKNYIIAAETGPLYNVCNRH